MFLRFAILAILTAGTAANADVTHLECLQIGPTEYKLTYSFTGDTHKVEIFTANTPDVPTTSKPVTSTVNTSITVHAGQSGKRMYFVLKADSGETHEVSIRHISLEGTPNFRDLGGYETTDHRFVRWGLLYRSGVLTYLTESDMKYLAQLGVRVVCDFRTAQENQTAPEKWIEGSSTKHVNVPIGSDPKKQGKDASLTPVAYDKLTPEQLRDTMLVTYRNFAINASAQYAEVFKQLENDHLPLLYHCTAGKDRTGVFSALVLISLGVPRDTVLRDYALTDVYLSDPRAAVSMQKMMNSTGNSAITSLSAETRKVMMAADPTYLEETLRQIDKQYGSFDEYRRQALHVSDTDMQKLRQRLLQ